MRLFAGYRGRIAAFFGGIDGNIDPKHEIAALKQGVPDQRRTIDFTPDVGHNLGSNASVGAMRSDRQEAIVGAIEQLSTACPRPAPAG